MAIYHQDIADIELNSGSILRTFLKRSIGLADAAANRFGVRVFRDGEPETLSGVTCQGFFKNADGVNIALTSYGTIDGNVAYVTLPAACYNVEGRFTLAIKLVGSDVTGTMRIVDGNVDNTNTSNTVAPTGSVPTYQEVLSVFEQMQDALDEYDAKVAEQDQKLDDLKSALDGTRNSIAQNYDDLTYPVAKGTYCNHNGLYYRAKQDIETEPSEWTSSQWSPCYLADDITYMSERRDNELKSALDYTIAGKTDFSGTWEIGNISSVGVNSNDNKTIRTVGRYPYYGGYLQFHGLLRGENESHDRIAYVYYYDASGTYIDRVLINNGAAASLPVTAAFYRLTYGYVAAEGKTISNAAPYIASYALYLITPDRNEIEGNDSEISEIRRDLIERCGGNMLQGNISPVNETYKNVRYEWSNGTCHVFNPDEGGASAMSYTDVFADANGFPEGIEAGKTYKVTGASSNVQFRVYQAVNGAFVSSPTIFTTYSGGYMTIPETASGLRLRLYVSSGTELDEYITPFISVEVQSEYLVFPHKIAMFGDSITAGRDGDAGAGTHTPYEIPKTVAKRLGCVVDNLGVGSMGWLAEGSGMNAYDKISSTDLSTYDVITLCFGVNDGFRPIGNYDSTDETEVMGQFNKVINYIFTQKPAVQVIVIAPFNGCNVGSFPKYWYGNVPSTAYSRGVLSDTLKQACEYYNIPYIEQKNGPLNGFTVKKDILDGNGKSLTYMGADGVHPSNAGYKALGGWISGEIARLIG